MNRSIVSSLLGLVLLGPLAACAPDSLPSDLGSDPSAERADGKPDDDETLGAACSMSRGNGSRAVSSLICNNRGGVAMYDLPSEGTPRVNVLRSTNSWFMCWGRGDRHRGGNDTWYGTIGDDNKRFGFVPAVHLATTSGFDANPSAEGLPVCNQCDKGSGRCPTRIDYD